MIGAGVGRGQQQEDEVDRAIVDRLVIDRVAQPREQAVDPVQAFDFAVGDRNAIRNAEVQRMKNRIRVLRAERDWSQAEVADRLGIARQTVNALEAGKYAPSLPLAFKISKLFEQPVEVIFDPNSVEE